MPDLSEDLNVDELRRRARRRLVGAIVLALGAAVIVPMLLESEPRPLGEDVAVKIPPVDDGKFVNRLNESSNKTDKAMAPKDGKSAATAVDGTTSAKSAEPRAKYDTRLPDKDAPAVEPKSAPARTEAPVPPKTEPTQSKAEPAPPKATPPKAEATAPRADASPPKSAPPPSLPPPAAAPNAAAATGATAAAGNGTFAVQLAAFSDDKGANALTARLKRAGYNAYTEPFKTTKGTLWRVRVGPYPNRDAANAVRDKLKAEGQNGIVAPSH